MLRSVPRISPRLAIAITFLLRGFVQGSWYPRIPGAVADVNVNPAQLGFIFFLFALGNMVAFTVAARLITRIGSPRTHALFALPFALIVVVLSFASGTTQFAIGMFAFGFLTGGFDISTSVQGAVTERRTRRPIMSALYGLFSVGALVGSFSSGLLAQFDVAIAYQFAVIGIIAIPLTILATASMLADDVVPASVVPRSRRLPSLPPKVLWPLGLMIVCVALGEETINNWAAIYLRDTLDASPAISSFAYTAFAIATAVGRLLGDGVIARVGVDRTLMAGSIIAAFGIGAGMVINESWAVIFGYTLMGLGLSIVVPVTYRRANDIPGVSRASAVATVASIGFIGFLVGPIVIGAIADLVSLRAAISAVSVVLLGVFVLTRLNPTPLILPAHDGVDSMNPTKGETL